MSEGIQMIHGAKMTEYTFEINRKVKVTLKGGDTLDNQEKAVYEAVAKVMKEIDENWLEYADANEFIDYEN